jgi:Sugar (and other) transporter
MCGLYLADIILLVAGPIALNNIQWKFFFVLIVPTAFHIVFVYFMCPETKGRSLEDINAQFGEQVAIHYYGATEAEKQELEAAAARDEDEELKGKRVGVDSQRTNLEGDEKRMAAVHDEVVGARA